MEKPRIKAHNNSGSTRVPRKNRQAAKDNRFIFLFLVFSLLLSVLFAAGQPSFAQAQAARKQVLYINSYHPGYKFSDDIMRAISDTFAKQGNIDLRVEYLDTKRLDKPEYLEQVKQLYQIKYKDAKLDLIMSSDDAALNFLFKNADTLFPGIPVVFVGANFFDLTRLAGFERFTGISEEADISGTLDVALSIHPNTRHIVVVNDTTVTGQKIHQLFIDLIPKYPQITFELLENVSMGEVRQRVASLTSDSLVLITIFSRDKDGAFFEYNQFTPLIAESSAVPVYGTWDFSLGYGIVGGKLTSGYTEGERGAKVAIRILNGEAPQSIPVEKQSQAKYMFDYNAMTKWNIDISRLPQGATIINRPVSFYEENTTLIWSVVIGFVVLLFVIVFLVINNNQRRIAQQELARSNRELQDIQVSLEKRVTERTQGLATVAEVGTAASTILETDVLLQTVLDLTKERFEFYHAHIYLLNEAGDTLVLASGAGAVGRQMVSEGRSIPLLREKSLVARAARERKGVTVNDVTQEPDFLPHPLLPNTRSELAVPMLVGENVIGVLDVQSDQVGRFTEADINIQTTLAAQIATAVQNARLYSQSQAARQEIQSLVEYAAEGIAILDLETELWAEPNENFARMFGMTREEMVKTGPKVMSPPKQPDGRDSVEKAVEMISTAMEKGSHRFEWVHTTLQGKNFDCEIGLVRMPGEHPRLRQSINDITERKRLERLTAQRAHEQEALNLITQKIQSATTVEAALQVAARELGHALGKKSTLVAIEPSALSGGSRAEVTPKAAE